MKMKFLYIPFFIALGISGCTQDNTKQNVDSKLDSTVSIQATNNIQLDNATEQSVLEKYLVLKNDLIKSDFEASQKSATALTHTLTVSNSFPELALQSKKVSVSKSLQDLRKHFTQLSELLITSIDKYKFAAGKVYVQHCPMANNGDGGDWLSAEREIKNPYYGDEMLACGAVIKEVGVK